MHNIKLVLAYDGTRFLGWQKTPIGPSVEQTLQEALEKTLQHSVVVQAASRTDAGVHADGQVANFLTSKAPNVKQLYFSLNQLLPKDVVVLEVAEETANFHPTLDCIGKEYRYYICCGPVQRPNHRFYSWHVYYPLDLQKMGEALNHLIGTHNFFSFCNVRKHVEYKDYVRTVDLIEIHSLEKNRVFIRIRGNNFLYKMVRNLVGLLVDIGRGKLEVEDIPKILHARDRKKAGLSAPAHGLFLHHVRYD